MASCVVSRTLGGQERTPSSFASRSLLKPECDFAGTAGVRAPVRIKRNFRKERPMKPTLRIAAMILALTNLTSVAQAQTTEKKSLTIDGAKKVIAAAVAYAKKNNAPGGVIAVVDEGGNLMALERLDGTSRPVPTSRSAKRAQPCSSNVRRRLLKTLSRTAVPRWSLCLTLTSRRCKAECPSRSMDKLSAVSASAAHRALSRTKNWRWPEPTYSPAI